MSLNEKLAKKRKELAEKGGKGNILFIKEGTTRIRILPVGDDVEWAMEVVQFYLNAEIKGLYSPSTFGEPCPIQEFYEKLSKSKKESDKELAKKLVPKKKYLVPAVIYKDTEGREIDKEQGIKLVQITADIYGQMIDYFLDPDYGDFTSFKNGYDFKITRTGKGKNDTTYSVRSGKPSKLVGFKQVDLEKMVRGVIPSYDELAEKLEEFKVNPADESGDDDAPRGSKKSNRGYEDDEPRKTEKTRLKKKNRS